MALTNFIANLFEEKVDLQPASILFVYVRRVFLYDLFAYHEQSGVQSKQFICLWISRPIASSLTTSLAYSFWKACLSGPRPWCLAFAQQCPLPLQSLWQSPTQSPRSCILLLRIVHSARTYMHDEVIMNTLPSVSSERTWSVHNAFVSQGCIMILINLTAEIRKCIMLLSTLKQSLGDEVQWLGKGGF